MKVGDKIKIILKGDKSQWPIEYHGEFIKDIPIEVEVIKLNDRGNLKEIKFPEHNYSWSIEYFEYEIVNSKSKKKLGKDPVGEVKKTFAKDISDEQNMKLLEKIEELRMELNQAAPFIGGSSNPIDIIGLAIALIKADRELIKTLKETSKEFEELSKANIETAQITIADLLGTKLFEIKSFKE